MYCKKCGTNVADGATVCPNCGEPMAENNNAAGQTVIIQQVAAPKNGMATAGLVFGILALIESMSVLFTAFLSLIYFIPFTIMAFIFGGIGLGRSKKMNGLGKGKSIAALVLAGIGVALWVILLVVLMEVA